MDYLRPKSLSEATALREQHPDFTVLAGGTDVMVSALYRPQPIGIIDLFHLSETRGVRSEETAVFVGATTTYSELLASTLVKQKIPMLWDAAREVGALQIQNRGTIGGNIATSSPVGDTLPVLLACDASLRIANGKGFRDVPYREFCTGYRTNLLKETEVLAGVLFPHEGLVGRQFWRKVGTRQAQSISKVMIAARAECTDGKLSHVRIAMGAVADRPIRLGEVENLLEGSNMGEALAEKAAETTANSINPIDDLRSERVYRLGVAANLVRRFVLGFAVEGDKGIL